jgi:hypothetical protein
VHYNLHRIDPTEIFKVEVIANWHEEFWNDTDIILRSKQFDIFSGLEHTFFYQLFEASGYFEIVDSRLKGYSYGETYFPQKDTYWKGFKRSIEIPKAILVDTLKMENSRLEKLNLTFDGRVLPKEAYSSFHKVMVFLPKIKDVIFGALDADMVIDDNSLVHVDIWGQEILKTISRNRISYTDAIKLDEDWLELHIKEWYDYNKCMVTFESIKEVQ